MAVTIPDLDVANTLQQDKFERLAAQWKRETLLLSKINDVVYHTAYQKIIGMGMAGVPLILKDLAENGPDHWFWALHVITEENPTTPDMAGKMEAMTEAWLQWGLPGMRKW